MIPMLVISGLSRDLILGIDFWNMFDLQIVETIAVWNLIQIRKNPFTVQCDATDSSVAGVLTQHFDGGEHVTAYVGQKLNPQQQD